MVNDREAIYTGYGETTMVAMLYVSALAAFLVLAKLSILSIPSSCP